MPPVKSKESAGGLMVNIFNGSRRPFAQSVNKLIRLIDGNQRHLPLKRTKKPNLLFRNLTVFDNFGDNYTVIISAKDHIQAGFTPVKIKRNTVQHIDLMLIREDGVFNFAMAQWEILQTTHPKLFELLSHGTTSSQVARKRYRELLENHCEVLAGFLNIVTAMSEIHLPAGSPLDYLKELIWDQIAQDRFFAWADRRLVGQVERAAAQNVFAPEVGSAIFHPGATKSFKQVQLGDANVQITFHEGDSKRIDGVDCVKVEPDIDYHRDLAAHTLLEVIPNSFSGRLTDPRQVYVLRWITGRHAGVPEFNPPYYIL